MKAKDTVVAYMEAVNTSPEQARGFLADDYWYVSPLFSADSADEFFQILGATAMDVHMTTESIVVEGPTVVHVGTLAIKHPVEVDVPMCEVFEVEDGKIVNSRNYFDAKLVSGFGEN